MTLSGHATPDVVVIGAGIVGTATAYELSKRGLAVRLLDRGEPGSGCSAGNSGAISPASVAPLAMPGLLSQLPAMLTDADSPLYLPLGYLPKAAPWLLRFVASARAGSVKLAAARIAALHQGALALHAATMHEVGVGDLLLRRGHLYVYPDAAALAKDAMGWSLRKEYGYTVEALDRDGILSLEPRLPARYQIGRYLPDQASVRNPRRYVEAIARALVARGGRMIRGNVRALRPENGKWRIESDSADGNLCADHVVVAAGAWSRRLIEPLGVKASLESQRGYHVHYPDFEQLVSRTVVLADRKVFITPMEDGLRIGGTVEIGGMTREPDPRRVAVLERIARETFADLGTVTPLTWMGHRPCMPDSIPVIGAAPGHDRLWLAFGHGHLGLTQSLPTAVRISQLITGAPT